MFYSPRHVTSSAEIPQFSTREGSKRPRASSRARAFRPHLVPHIDLYPKITAHRSSYVCTDIVFSFTSTYFSHTHTRTSVNRVEFHITERRIIACSTSFVPPGRCRGRTRASVEADVLVQAPSARSTESVRAERDVYPPRLPRIPHVPHIQRPHRPRHLPRRLRTSRIRRGRPVRPAASHATCPRAACPTPGGSPDLSCVESRGRMRRVGGGSYSVVA